MYSNRLVVGVWLLIITLAPSQTVMGQSLRDKIGNIFSEVLDIELAGPGAHGTHFRADNVASSEATINSFSSFISANIATFPLGSTEAGLTFDFSTGQPVSTTTSTGPIFSERAQTLGKGRFSLGLNLSFLNLSKLRGLDTEDIRFTFTHQDVGAPGLGDSDNEFDTIDLFMDLDLNATIVALYLTAGITNNFDISIAVPFVNVSVKANPIAQVSSFTFVSNDTANHRFGGTPSEPILSLRPTPLNDDDAGIGDIALRAKYSFLRGKTFDLAGLLEYRAATGDEENFLGAGSSTFRAMLIASTIIGNFGPHLNLAYDRRNSDLDPDDIAFFVGYDQKLATGLTLAVDFLGEFEIGDAIEALRFEKSATLERPVGNAVREVMLTNIPNFSHDHNLNASLGLKFNPKPEFILIGNVIVPLNDGGLRSDFIATVGFQLGF
ncbi:MAG: transporter [bacterium]